MRRALFISLLLPALAASTPVYRLVELRADSTVLASSWQDGRLFESVEGFEKEARAWLRDMDARGFPFAQVWTSPLEAEGDTLDFAADLLPGPGGPLGEARVLGGDRLSEEFLLKLLRLPDERPFNLLEAERGRERLAGTGWFASLDDPVLGWDPVERRVGVVYRVKERTRRNRAAILLGGGSGQRFGTLDLSLFSPFGGGRQWTLAGEWRSDDRSQVDIELREPRILGQPLDLGLRFFRSLRDSTWSRQLLELDLELPLPSGWRGRVLWGFERTLFPLEDLEISRRRQGLGIRWRGVGAEERGERTFSFDTDLLNRKEAGEEERQWELSGQWRWTQPIREDVRIRWRIGGVWLYSPSPISEAELYPLGGAATLRGWDEEHFRGDRLGSGSLELAVGRALELAAFLDYGRGRRDTGEEALSFEGWGGGIGLRAPGERGSLILDIALGEGVTMSDLRVHLKLETGF